MFCVSEEILFAVDERLLAGVFHGLRREPAPMRAHL